MYYIIVGLIIEVIMAALGLSRVWLFFKATFIGFVFGVFMWSVAALIDHQLITFRAAGAFVVVTTIISTAYFMSPDK